MSYFILDKDLREKFLLICEKMNISRQSITDPEGYYNLLIKHNYNPLAIEDIKVRLNPNVGKITPLKVKRKLFIIRHLANFKPHHLRRLLSFIAWAYKPNHFTSEDIRELITKLYFEKK